MSARVRDVMTTWVVAAGKGVTFKDLVAGTWHVQGVVPVRDRLAYPEGK
jgi:hypothetical protein